MKRSALAAIGMLSAVHIGVALAAGDPEAGRAKATTCAACHGPDGNSTVAVNPKLAGQHADYLVLAMKAYQDGTRQVPIKQGLMKPLSEQEIEDLAAFYAAQTPQ